MAISYDSLTAYINGLHADGTLSDADYNSIILYIEGDGNLSNTPRDLIQIRRGNFSNLPELAQGELGFCIDSKQLFVGGLTGNVEIGEKSWSGNFSNLPELAQGELGYCIDSKQLFVGGQTGNDEIGKRFRKCIIVGDSWAVGYYDLAGHAGQGWGDYCAPLLGIPTTNVLNVASGGSGFINGTGEHFNLQIKRAYDDYINFRDADLILCVGGFNDAQDNRTYEEVKNAAGAFFENCKLYFPNAETHMFPLQLPWKQTLSAERWNVLSAIKNAFYNETSGKLFLHCGAHRWANEFGAGADDGDGAHLNQYGYSYMGQKIAELVQQGGDYYPTLYSTFGLTNIAAKITETITNRVVEFNGILTSELAINVSNLAPTDGAILPPDFAANAQTKFISVDGGTTFLTWDINGLTINAAYTGWIFLILTHVAGC